MGQSSEEQNYEAVEVWLQSHFEDIKTFDLDLTFEIEMRNNGITLPEVLHTLRAGSVVYSDRNRRGCVFSILGRNCDEEEIQIFGGFSSDTQVVSLISIEKTR